MNSPTIDFEAMAKQVIGIDQKPAKPAMIKYVILDYMGMPTPVLFPAFIQHDMVVDGSVISAGFCQVNGNQVSVSGHSESLEVSSRPEDKEIIENFLRS